MSILDKVVVIGGGLAGLSAAHTVLERGGNVVVIDKNPFMGGNSTKATSGINGTLTKTQILQGVKDSVDAFLKDTIISAAGGDPNAQPYELAQVLTSESGPAVEWLIDNFGLDLSLLSRLGGHSFPRTHRGKERFPGMTITYALMEKLEAIAAKQPDRVQIHTKSKATKLITSPEGNVIGVEYQKGGQTFSEHGAVIIATGGYGADFSEGSLLMKYRPDLAKLSTTNGDHCTGDGIKMAVDVGAALKDMDRVQVHPTGLIHPDEPDAKVLFLAAEALRGVGGLILDREGQRFCNELGRRDYVSAKMQENKGPFRLVLNGAAAKEIEWHCKHYVGRGLMKRYENGREFAKDVGLDVSVLEKTFKEYNEVAKKGIDQWEKKFFQNVPFDINDVYHVAFVTPVIHYCMGGILVNADSQVCREGGQPIPGLFCTGEAMGGTHGKNRLGGSSLLDCVVFGRVSGRNSVNYLFQKALQFQKDAASGRLSNLLGQVAGISTTVNVNPQSNSVSLHFNWGPQSSAPQQLVAAPQQSAAAPQQSAPAAPPAPQKKELKTYSADEVAQHNKESDCWVVVNKQVLDLTTFLPDHPGGKRAILLFAGKDATEEFNMLHKPDVVEKYAPESIIGNIKQ